MEKPLAQLQKIYDVFRTSSKILEGKLSGRITKLLDNFLYSPDENRGNKIYGSTMADAISYINEHFQCDLSLETLAAEANMSPYHFTRVFTKETGITPHQYLIKTRLSAAKYLLKSTETSVKNIAFSTGFHSETSFCITFKNGKTSLPPSTAGRPWNNTLWERPRGCSGRSHLKMRAAVLAALIFYIS